MQAHSGSVRALAILVLSLCTIIPLLLSGCGSGAPTAESTPTVSVKLIVPTAVPTATSLPPTAEPTHAGTSGGTYVVKSGDTLSKIAADFGVSVDDIVKANNIADPNVLKEGQELVIPPKSASTPVATQSAATPTVEAASTPSE
jgi:LysM repeat protein